VLPLFEREAVGAVQVRKAIANGGEENLTQGQVAEMALIAISSSSGLPWWHWRTARQRSVCPANGVALWGLE